MNPALTPGERFDFCADYCAPPEVYDEMCSAPGSPRPHWDYVIRALGALGTQELGRRAQEARRLLRDNGVTYNVYHASRGEERPWVLDPIPVLLTSQEWSTVETGLSQRAELLNLILADLYGPKRLIRQGLLPPELVYSYPGFLLPCEGIRPTSERYLSLYTADLARAPSGSFWVIGDRTQAPSGAGDALENRVVLSRVLPSLYRDAQVHRLALFFRTLRATLVAMAPRSQDNPRIVLLTPGPGNETYFEHAYLAQYLDYTLVQGGDLTVRDGRVWLKTLDGLQPVEVILRRVDDTFCDPLELRKDSLLGTPGLVQAARLKQIAIANPLGSGVLENPGLMAFLPGIARYLLGEELRIPSVATWWCGTKQECSYVLAHLERLVIKPIFPHPSASTITGLSSESMSRGQSFRFMEIGRRLERALYTISLLRAVCELPPAAANSGWEMVLAVTDSLMTYSRRYRAHVEAGAVLDLLLHDEHNPRSVGYQLVRLQEHIAGLPRKASLPYRSAEERAVLEALTALRVADVDGLSRPVWDEKTYDALSQLFARLSALLLTLSDVLTRRYFSHTELPQQLVDNQS
jgi:uncharacterized circularly permuted ATP-grasp superfamily protein